MYDDEHNGTVSQSPPGRTLLSSADEIDAYYANPLFKANRGEQLREMLSRRLNRELTEAGSETERADEAAEALPRHGYRLAFGVVFGSVILVAVVMIASARSFAVNERSLQSQILRFYSTETRVLEEIRREAAEVLRRKDEEIARYLQSLRQMDLRRAELERELNRAADERRAEFSGLIAAQVEAESRRLGALGLTESEIAARLTRFRIDLERAHADKLDDYVEKLTEEHQSRLRALLRQRETAQKELAAVTVERETLLLTTQERPAPENTTTEISVIGRMQERAILEGLFRTQLRKHLDAVTGAISADDFERTRREIGDLDAFLSDGSVREQEALAVDIRFAERLSASFRALLAGAAPKDTASNPPLPPAEERRAPPDARLARAAALDAVANFIDTLLKSPPSGAADTNGMIRSVEPQDPQLASVLRSILRAVDQRAAESAAAAQPSAEKKSSELSLAVVGTVAFAGEGAVVVERLSSAPISVGSRLLLRRPGEGRSEVPVAEATVTRVRDGFLDASIEKTLPAPLSPRVLDIAYRRAVP